MPTRTGGAVGCGGIAEQSVVRRAKNGRGGGILDATKEMQNEGAWKRVMRSAHNPYEISAILFFTSVC